MDVRIQQLINTTKEKFGLENYKLGRYRLDRSVDIFKNTAYILCMEWFPNHVTDHDDDGSNPEGTAVIEMDVHSHKVKSAIFVMGKTYANNGISFLDMNKNEIIEWIEQETGLTFGQQLQMDTEEEGRFAFKECVDGISVSPSGLIELKFDQDGNLILFTVHGQFPSKEMVKEETYTLSFGKIEEIAKGQIKLIEFPSFEKQKLIPVYAVEEIYVLNDGSSTIPFELIVDARSYLKVDQTITWNESIQIPFERNEIHWLEEVSVEQAFSNEPSPESFPITMEEQEKCIDAVKDLLRSEYPNDAGKWIVKSLHRDKGYIHVILKTKKQTNHVFQRKLSIMIDAKNLKVKNYLDNQTMLAMFQEFQAAEEVTVSQEEAYKKLEPFFELKPYYVYDFEQEKYVLCGKLDCQYSVHAATGEVIELDQL